MMLYTCCHFFALLAHGEIFIKGQKRNVRLSVYCVLYKNAILYSHQPTYTYMQSIKNLNFNIKNIFFFFGFSVFISKKSHL